MSANKEKRGRARILRIKIRYFATFLKIYERWGNSNALLKNENYRKTMMGGGNAGV